MAEVTALTNPVYEPARRTITDITRAFPAQVTTSFAHNYITGTIVRIDIPETPTGATSIGMTQINQMFGPITVTSDTTFTLPIDSTNFDTFVGPSTLFTNYPQAVPIGEVSSILDAAVQNVLPT